MTKMGTQVNYTNQDQSFIVGKFKINYDSEVNTHYTVVSSRNSFKTVMLRSLSRFNIYKKIIVKKSLDTVTLTFPPPTRCFDVLILMWKTQQLISLRLSCLSHAHI